MASSNPTDDPSIILGNDVNQSSESRPKAEKSSLYEIRSFSDDTIHKSPSDSKTTVLEKMDIKDKTMVYLTGLPLFAVIVSLMFSFLLISLDQTIAATAIPVIVTDFNALDLYAWIASAYFLTTTAFKPIFGKLLTVFPRKYLYLLSIFTFEIGSFICGIAFNMNILIIGRAIAGLGGAGIMVSTLTIISDIIEPYKRPTYMGLLGAVYGLASVMGPLLGGTFTEHVSWRWCFYINLPIGAISMAICFLFLPNLSSTMDDTSKTFWEKLRRFDYVGTVLLLGGIICLLLALQWGGSTYPWKSSMIIGLTIGGGVILAVFVYTQAIMDEEKAIIPGRLFKYRTVSAVFFMQTFVGVAFFAVIFYIPLYFQAVRGDPATISGLEMLPLVMSIVIFSILGGGISSYTGYYMPFLPGGASIAAVGLGLIYTWTELSSYAQQIGYQIMAGAGLGLMIQMGIVAIQATVDTKDIAQGTGLVTFAQTLGGVLGMATLGSVFDNKIVEYVYEFAPNAPPYAAANATGITSLPDTYRDGILHAYVKALSSVWLVALPSICVAFILSLFVEHRNIRGKKVKRSI